MPNPFQRLLRRLLGFPANHAQIPLAPRLYALSELIPDKAELSAHFDGSALTHNTQRLQMAHDCLWRCANDIEKTAALSRLASEAEAESQPVKLY